MHDGRWLSHFVFLIWQVWHATSTRLRGYVEVDRESIWARFEGLLPLLGPEGLRFVCRPRRRLWCEGYPLSKRMMRVLGGFGTRPTRHARAHWHAEESTWRILSISHLVCPLGNWPYAKRGERLHRPHRPQNRHISRSNSCIFSTRKKAMTEAAQPQERLRPLLWKRFLLLEECNDPPGV